jgi:predicted secreted protein
MSYTSLTLTPHANVDATFPTTVRNFTIRLPSSATSGYSWYVLRNPSAPEPWQVVFVGRDASSCTPGVVGCGGTEVYTLHLTSAPKPGDVLQVPFILARPFDLTGTLSTQPTNYVFRLRFRAL